MNIFLTCRDQGALLFHLLRVLALLLNQTLASATHKSPYEARVEACFSRLFNDMSVDLAGASVIPAEAFTRSPPTELHSSPPLVARTQHVFETTPNAVVEDTGKTND